MLRLSIASILLCAVVFITPSLAAETNCRMIKLAELPTTLTAADIMMVPIKVDGFDTRMMVDTGAFWSVIADNVGSGLPPRTALNRMVDAAGSESNRYVTVPKLGIGGHEFHDADFYLAGPVSQPGVLGGNLGTNVLGLADLEIDPAHARIAFFARDHCPNQVVYWPHTDLIEIPIHVSRFKEVSLQVKLDGEKIWARLDTGATLSVLSAAVAARRFGLKAGSADMQSIGNLNTFSRAIPAQKHQFETLDIGGVIFGHPLIAISPDKSAAVSGVERSIEANGGEPSDLILGMHQIRMLHLYIDYADNFLYATKVGGDAKAVPSGNSAPSDTAPGKPASPTPSAASEAADGAFMPDAFDLGKVKDIVARGMQALAAHRPDEAIVQFDAALATVPRNPTVLLDRANAEREQGNYPAAMSDVNAVLVMQPLLINAYAIRATIYTAQGDLPRAVADANYIVALQPKSVASLIGAGNLLLDAKAPDTALTDFNAAASLSPKAVNPQIGRCRALTAQHDYATALGACDQAIALEPKSGWPVAVHGFVHLAAGQANDAQADFDAALALDPHNPAALYGRSIMRRRHGDTAGADADLAAAKATNSRIERLYDGA